MSIDLCLPSLEERTWVCGKDSSLTYQDCPWGWEVLPKPQAQGPKMGEGRRKQPLVAPISGLEGKSWGELAALFGVRKVVAQLPGFSITAQQAEGQAGKCLLWAGPFKASWLNLFPPGAREASAQVELTPPHPRNSPRDGWAWEPRLLECRAFQGKRPKEPWTLAGETFSLALLNPAGIIASSWP